MSKTLTVPLGEVLDGFRSVMRKLCPFEEVVVELTVKSRELAGYGSLKVATPSSQLKPFAL